MSIFAKTIIFSDDSHSDLDGYANKQNCRIWGTENPNTLKQNEALFEADFGPEA